MTQVKEYDLTKEFKIYVEFYGEEGLEPHLIMSYNDKAIAEKCCLSLLKKKSYILKCYVK